MAKKPVSFKPNRAAKALAAVAVLAIAWYALRNRKNIAATANKTANYIIEKTWDIVSDRRIARLHPRVRAAAKTFIHNAEKQLGVKLRVTSGLRTWGEQDALYAKGRTRPGKVVTNARGGQSLHNYGLAIDVVEIKNGKAVWENPRWAEIARVGKAAGFEWGGDWRGFKDRPHFEMRFGKTVAELRRLYTDRRRDGPYVRLS